jgi:hypothetical protein
VQGPLSAAVWRSVPVLAGLPCQCTSLGAGVDFRCLRDFAGLCLTNLPKSFPGVGRRCRSLPVFAGPSCQGDSGSSAPFGRRPPGVAGGGPTSPDYLAKSGRKKRGQDLSNHRSCPLFFPPLQRRWQIRLNSFPTLSFLGGNRELLQWLVPSTGSEFLSRSPCSA